MLWRAGELDQLIDIHRPVLTDNETGGQDVSLIEVSTNEWAKFKSLSGGESPEHQKQNQKNKCLFVIRYRNDLKPSDRITWEGQVFNIKNIRPTSPRSLYLEIEAEAGGAQ